MVEEFLKKFHDIRRTDCGGEALLADFRLNPRIVFGCVK